MRVRSIRAVNGNNIVDFAPYPADLSTEQGAALVDSRQTQGL